jgi:pyruvate kinase
MRIGSVRENGLSLHPGQRLTVGLSAQNDVPITQREILAELKKGDRLLLGDGNVELLVRAQRGRDFEAVAVTGGTIRSRQGITLAGKSFHVEAFTKQDRSDLEEACRLGADFIAISYVHTPEELQRVRKALQKQNSKARLCAKIETCAALKNIDAILRESDFAMVARGDLGLQMNLEDVPHAQKEIIRKCNALGKPVITATQMLESMIAAPRPTRAEVADVANAILDGTDAVMLSGETATGAFPTQCVETMARIAAKAESILDHEAILARETMQAAGKVSPAFAIAHAVARLAESIAPKAILTTSTSGQTACLVSKYRPRTPILCATWNQETCRQLSVVWGVDAIHMPLPKSTDEIVKKAMEGFVRHKRLKTGDSVIVTAGVPPGPGKTNLILHEVVR